jgi:SAM-dependent methyltransferase
MSLLSQVLLFILVSLGLLALLARQYITIRRYISGDHGDDLPIGELPDNQKLVDLCCDILKDHGLSLDKPHLVLDFGCGTGRHTYEFRDRGYQALGFDTSNYVRLRDPSDSSWFLFPKVHGEFRIPAPDETFDFIFSNHVLEHTLDYESAFQEMHRVLKAGGTALHIFPSRLRIIEPHMYVPFAGVFRTYPYFLFWAVLGVRNEMQANTSATEAARMNLDYAGRGVNYLPKRRVLLMASRYFRKARFVEGSYIEHTRHVSVVSRWANAAMKLVPGACRIYGMLHTRVLLLEK